MSVPFLTKLSKEQQQHQQKARKCDPWSREEIVNESRHRDRPHGL